MIFVPFLPCFPRCVKYPESPNTDAECPALINLDTNDKIRIAGFSDEINGQFGQCLESGGLQIERKDDTGYKYLDNGYEFKIAGTPWYCDGEEAVKSRYALGNCLEMLRLNNFSVLTCFDVSRSVNDKSAFVLVPSANKKSLSTLIVSISDRNQLRFVGKFNDEELEQFMEPLRNYAFGIHQEFWKNDIFESLGQNSDRCYKVEFNWEKPEFFKAPDFFAGPWAFCPGEEIEKVGWHTISMIGNLFYKIECQGWKVNCSGEVCGSSVRGRSIDGHCWFLSRMK